MPSGFVDPQHPENVTANGVGENEAEARLDRFANIRTLCQPSALGLLLDPDAASFEWRSQHVWAQTESVAAASLLSLQGLEPHRA